MELILFLFVYFAPAIVANSLKHKNSMAIFVTNLIFGWTGLGWGLSLIWAVKK